MHLMQQVNATYSPFTKKFDFHSLIFSKVWNMYYHCGGVGVTRSRAR